MILGGKLPGKVGRCRFFIARKANTTVNIAPFRQSTVSHDHNGVAAGEEIVKLAGEPARYMDVAGFFIARKANMIMRKETSDKGVSFRMNKRESRYQKWHKTLFRG